MSTLSLQIRLNTNSRTLKKVPKQECPKNSPTFFSCSSPSSSPPAQPSPSGKRQSTEEGSEDDSMVISFNTLTQIPELGLTIIAFLTLSRFFNRYGLRQLLFLDCLDEDSIDIRGGGFFTHITMNHLE
ncbi:hypothetical protein G4B88_009526 [Cannabis sativa]|uniref:Uncharacterized protein n=1 Tax=Cannabis sativa TaxID=3483 RepID=A0A7J6FF20_CANSA|nr:hypothetical protein G4B88_009526 [Cannabis sativa]